MERDTVLGRASRSPPSRSPTLALGLVVIALAVRLQGTPGVHSVLAPHVLVGGARRRWRARSTTASTYSDTWSGPSWAAISMMVVVAVSYLLAASVVEVLGLGRGRVFWVLRSAGQRLPPGDRGATPG